MLRALACFALAVSSALGAHADPPKSEACGAALAALEQARRSPGSAVVEGARGQATRACLGGSGEARRPSPTAQAPVAVPPPVIEAEPAQPVPARPAAPPPPERPPVITSCDLGGCWDSSGRRLDSAGPVLIGPRGGVCTTVGTTVHCP